MSLDALDALYKEVILDHYQSPRHHHALDAASVATEGFNPSCGDQITLQLLIKDGKIADVGFMGKGCAISQSSASMMTDTLLGKSLEDAEALADDFRAFMTEPDAPAEGLGDLEVLEGVRKFPVRVKCATLGWVTLQEAVKDYRKGSKEGKLVIEDGGPAGSP